MSNGFFPLLGTLCGAAWTWNVKLVFCQIYPNNLGPMMIMMGDLIIDNNEIFFIVLKMDNFKLEKYLP